MDDNFVRLPDYISPQEIRTRLKEIKTCSDDEISLFFLYLQRHGGIAAIDIDGVLCEEKGDYATRQFLSPVPRHKYKYTILFTARLERDRKATEMWLKKNGIRYDALIMNKLPYNILIDDKAMDANFHRKHFLDESEHKAVNRYVEITAQYINLFLREDMKVLDVGGADGIMLQFVKGKGKSIDLFPASERVHEGTIYDEPDNCYDAIIYNHVLEHIPRYYSELEKAVACLKKDGVLFIACPYYTTEWANVPEDHIVLFSEEILRKLMASLGMKVLEYSKHCFRGDKVEQWLVAKKS